MSASVEQTRVGGAFGTTVASVVVAGMSVALVVSFASIVYAGALEPFRARAIGLALLGSIPMAIIGAAFSSYRGTILQAQDVTSLLLSVSAASVAGAGLVAADRLFATVVGIVLVAAITTGVVSILVGRFRLAHLGRFIPHSVIGGFLAATGYLLTMGAAGMMVGEQVTIWTLEPLVGFDVVARWVPWILASAAMVYAVRRTGNDLFVLVGLAGSACVFYVVQALGGGLDQARASGLLLGPFDSGGFLGQIDLTEVVMADWSVVAGEVDVILAVAAMAVLGALLNATGLEVSVGEDVDLERELATAGVANIAAGLGGGLTGFTLLSETLLASRLGLRSQWAGLTVAAACAVTLVFGASLISIVPVGLVAAVIAFLGIDLMITWLWVEGRRMPIGDRLVIGLVVLVAATVGFLQAIFVGVLTATFLFVRSYASIDVVWMHSTLASRRSSVERSGAALDRLSERGDGVLVYELSGYVFFGSASRLLDRLGSDLVEARPETVIIDMARVHGIDTSATAAILRFADVCSSTGVDLVVTGIASRLEVAELREVESMVFFPRLDDALREIEDHLLDDVDPAPAGLVSWLTQGDSIAGVGPVPIPTRQLPRGSHLTKQGDAASLVYYVTKGELRAEVHRHDGRAVVVATFRPGAFIGEISHYTGLPRTADVVAQIDSEVLVIDIDTIEADPRRAQLAAELHREIAAHLARRLMHTTAALRDRT